MPDWEALALSFITSPWLYAILLALSLLDSFLPLIPSEPVIVIAGVYAAAGDTNLTLVILATGVGAFLGDQIPYGAGRLLESRLLKRLPPGTKRRATHDLLARQLATRGGYLLLFTRFIPVGRYLATLTAGMVGYSFRNYIVFTAIGGMAWSIYMVLTGYIGGVAFRDNQLLAVGAGLALALLSAAVIELARRLRRRPAVTPG